MPFNLLLLLLLTCSLPATSQTIRLNINKESGVYEKGELARVTCHADEAGSDSLRARVFYNNRLGREYRLPAKVGDFTVLEQALDSTCAVSVELKSAGGETDAIGFVVAPEGFRAGYDEPSDLMDYWRGQKEQLSALPMEVWKTPLDVPDPYKGRYDCQDLEINCLGPAPVRAYMAKPLDARPRSLPIVVLCRAAGVSGNWCRCQVGECLHNAALGNGALSLDINAHGMLNGQSDEYYKMLEEGLLLNYFNHNAADRETYYFRGMYLRLLRAIEYMTQQPEWDGRRILVIGESQGGGQAAAAAGLDQRVSAVVLHVPAMQDLGGPRAGRRGGWPQPIENHPNLDARMLDATLPYFDGALLLRHSRAEIFCEMGLIDTTCPPSAVWSSLNGAPGKKTVLCAPFRTHAWPSERWRAVWNEKYLRPRLEFIENYLK
ncbi:MAG: acetylxylan esterase [Bacteroidaceae bacterium]|nr:acetylxylan esterase [Bacteroidaceae bacterium]